MESSLNRKKWSEDEIKILKEKYPEMGSKCSLFIGRNEISVKSKAKKLKLKYDNRDAWTHYDMDKLLMTFPGRSYNKIMGKARQLSLKSETNRARRGCLDYLDILTPESVYWWGFIMADGHIRYDIKHKSCTIELHSSWYKMMVDFSEYLFSKYSIKSNVVYTKGGKYVRFYTQNKDNMKKLKSLISGLPYLGRKWDKIIL